MQPIFKKNSCVCYIKFEKRKTRFNKSLTKQKVVRSNITSRKRK